MYYQIHLQYTGNSGILEDLDMDGKIFKHILKETECDSVEEVHLAQDMDQ